MAFTHLCRPSIRERSVVEDGIQCMSLFFYFPEVSLAEPQGRRVGPTSYTDGYSGSIGKELLFSLRLRVSARAFAATAAARQLKSFIGREVRWTNGLHAPLPSVDPRAFASSRQR